MSNNRDILARARKAVASGKCTKYRLQQLTGIPNTSLREMLEPDFTRQVFENIDKLEKALDELDRTTGSR